MGSPVCSRAWQSMSSPSYANPWKEYGDVRGLNAPPRSTVAPASFTACATAEICSLLSTEQGPAIIASFLPPTTVFPILISLGAGWNARFAFLNGSATFMMRSTQWKDSSWSGSMRLVSPVRPRMVISVPTIGLTDTPRATTALVTVSISCWVVPCFKTIIMVFNLLRQSLLAQMDEKKHGSPQKSFRA